PKNSVTDIKKLKWRRNTDISKSMDCRNFSFGFKNEGALTNEHRDLGSQFSPLKIGDSSPKLRQNLRQHSKIAFLQTPKEGHRQLRQWPSFFACRYSTGAVHATSAARITPS
ncbi:MAG: hypothetical protein PHU77_00005, partial [Simplicispira sp.]|nr:hypothetical protein [Simplicispira sp.]